MTTELYTILRGKAYRGLALVGLDHTHARTAGFTDGWAMLMHPDNWPKMSSFLALLLRDMPDTGHRQVLLDGLAQQYTEYHGWIPYAIATFRN